MATQLEHYNAALEILGETPLASLTEARKPRYDLDRVWDRGFVKLVLSKGSWNFAIRTSRLSFDSGLEPAFGYSYIFTKPSDMVRLTAISGNERLGEPLLDYRPEGGYIYADIPDIYVSYVSDEADYGGTITNWPETLDEYANHLLAHAACRSISQSSTLKKDIKMDMRLALSDAKALDGMAEAPKFFPQGRFVGARRGSRIGRFD